MRILVADDDQSVRRLLEHQLTAGGHEVTLAADGSDAWAALRKGGIRLAILDWNMPGIDGVEICRRLQEAKSNVYAIILTATDDSSSLAKALDAGASDFIVKPWHVGVLLARVNVGIRIISMQSRLAESQKLESIGQLAAGIAHEINTPIQYVGDNIRFLSDSIDDLLSLVGSYRDIVSQSDGGVEITQQFEEKADLAYIEEEIPNAIKQSLEGVDRVSRIVGAMKDFSHPGAEGKNAVDLNRAIESTITVARNEWKFVADVVTDFDPLLPPVPCLPGEFNQVILNLIVNAAHAIADVVGSRPETKGIITVSTRLDGAWVEVRIADTGTGIAEAHRSRIFDHFFTTKEVGKGTGQGLAIAYAVVTDKHGGTITFETEVGKGTTFVIRLPLEVRLDDAQETPVHEEAYSLR